MGAFLQGNELLIILVILLLILGPTKLPALARGLGQAVREFRKAAQGAYDEEEKKQSLSREELEAIARKLGIETQGKTDEELAREVAREAERRGLK